MDCALPEEDPHMLRRNRPSLAVPDRVIFTVKDRRVPDRTLKIIRQKIFNPTLGVSASAERVVVSTVISVDVTERSEKFSVHTKI